MEIQFYHKTHNDFAYVTSMPVDLDLERIHIDGKVVWEKPKPKFKVGDYVRVSGCAPVRANEYGKVLSVESSGLYYIEFARASYSGSIGNVRGVLLSHLELLPEYRLEATN